MEENLKRILKKIIPKPAIRLLKKKYRIISSQHFEEVKNNEKNRLSLEILQSVDLKISFNDEMYPQENGVHYLDVGLSAMRCIERAIQDSEISDIRQILDLPCGHGRVLRFIKQRFPSSQITACDTNKDGVDFCEREFNAQPVYSQPNLKDFNIGKRFDLIWCGSLATHFSECDTTELLKFFYRHLNYGGLLVFSMHGKLTAEKLRTKNYSYGLSSDAIEKVLFETQTLGYGYADYDDSSGYGISCTTKEWMLERLEQVGKWQNFNFYESAWDNHHDIYSVVKQQ